MVSGISGVSSGIDQTTMQEMRAKMFSRADSNSDGGVNATEFSEVTTQMAEMTGVELDSEALFSQYDSDEDGSLNEDELHSFHEDQREAMGPPPGFEPESIEQMRQDIFSKLDTNGDGSIDEEEFAAGAPEAPEGAEGSEEMPSSEEVFSEMDINEDGVVTLDEMQQYEEEKGIGRHQPPPPPPDGESTEMTALSGESSTSAGYNYTPVDIVA